MECTLSLLSDLPGTKTVCIQEAGSASNKRNSRVTRVTQMFLRDSARASNTVVTVVVKGTEIPERLVEKLVSDYFTRMRDSADVYRLEIDDQEMRAFHPAKSLTNSMAISRPPSIS